MKINIKLDFLRSLLSLRSVGGKTVRLRFVAIIYLVGYGKCQCTVSTMAFSESGPVFLILMCVVCEVTTDARPTHEQRYGCIYNRNGNFLLQCDPPKVIHITKATAGVSSDSCRRNRQCCPDPSDHETIPRRPYALQSINEHCNRRSECDASVPQLYYKRERYDYYSVSYICSNANVVSSTGTDYVGIQCQQNQQAYIVNAILENRVWKDQPQHKCSSNPLECAVFSSAQHLQYVKRECNEHQICNIHVDKTWYIMPYKYGVPDFEIVEYVCVNKTSAVIVSTPAISDGGRRKSQHITQPNVVIIAGATAASCLLVVCVVFVIVYICWRRRRPAQYILGNYLSETASINPTVQPGASYRDRATHCSDDTHVYYNMEHRGSTSGSTRVFRNEELVSGGAERNHQMSPNISLDELYSKPNKQRKNVNISKEYENVHVQGRYKVDRDEPQELAGVRREDLEYADMDHSASHGTRSMVVDSMSSKVIYAEIQHNMKDNDTGTFQHSYKLHS